MTAATADAGGLRARWRTPLYRNGYALVLNTVVSGGLGLAFWVIAARSYSTAAVGVCAALIAAMTLIGDLSHLNLKGALNRFLPAAGAASTRFALRSYAVALAVAAAAAAAFVAGIEVWSPELAVLHRRPELAALFILGAMGWTVFVLQDSVLTGIRRAAWVPADNLLFAVGKLVVLVALVAAVPTYGIFVAWSLPVLLLTIPVNILIFRWLMPAHVRETCGRTQVVPPRDVASYVAADYFAYLVWTATQGLLPLVILNVLGPEQNAYYFLAWTMAYSLYLISSSMGNALLAEASLRPEALWPLSRQAVVESARLVLPATAAVVIGAPLILSAVGQDYAAEGTTVLRLLALSAIPFIIVSAFVKARSVQRRMRSVVAAEVWVSVIVVVLSAALIGPLGTTGLAIAWLAAQSAVAGWIILMYGRARRAGNPSLAGSAHA